MTNIMANATTISALLLLLSSSPHVLDASAFVSSTTFPSSSSTENCHHNCRRVASVGTSIDARPRKSTTTMEPQTAAPTPTKLLPSWTHHSKEDVIAVIIDAENVRGRTGFELDHADLLDRLLVWTSMRYGYAYGKTIVVIDHGSQTGAILLRGDSSLEREDGGKTDDTTLSNLCVAFAGPHCKADDIIARDVKWLLASSSCGSPPSSSNRRRKVVIVITADQELTYRCRSAAATALVTSSSDDANNVVSKTKKKKSRAERMRQFTNEPHGLTLESDTVVSDENLVNSPTVEVISPQRFLEDLDLAVHEWLQRHEQQHHNASSIDSANTIKNENGDRIFTTTSTFMEVQKSLNLTTTTTTTSIMPSPVSTMSDLFQLRGRILKLESVLRDKLSLHKRSTTLGELRKCKVEWRRVFSMLIDDTDGHYRSIEKKSVLSSLAWSLSSTIASLEMYDDYVNNDLDMSTKELAPLLSASTTSITSPSSSWERLSPTDQERLLLHWSKDSPSGRRGKNVARREKTEDRIVLAERLQMQLNLIFNRQDMSFIDVRLDAPLVDVYSKFVNTNYEVYHMSLFSQKTRKDY